jgi:lysophospholipid acyltransferase (LPLAT)-like uncharacterized protein
MDNVREKTAPRKFTRWQRFMIFLASYLGYALVYLIGCTLRWEVHGWEHWESIFAAGKRAIYTIWHGRVLPATWFWRKRGIVALNGQNFDAEYVSRLMRMHGYGSVRGSSSRGGMRALREMAKCLRKGLDVGFTIDGPRGPRYEAKIGPVLLAKQTGAAIFCIHVSTKGHIQLNSWDHFQIPFPFTRALMLMAPPIYVPPDATRQVILEKHAEMQRTLDALREKGDAWWKRGEP